MKRRIGRILDKLRIKQKLILSYAIIVFIPVLVLGIYSYVQSKKLLRDQAMQAIEKNIGTAADSIGDNIEHYHSVINLVIGNRTIEEILSNKSEDQANLSKLANQLNDFLDPYFKNLFALNQGMTKLTIYTERAMPEYGDFIRSSAGVQDQGWYREAIDKFGVRWHADTGIDFRKGLVAVNKFPETFTTGRHVLFLRVETAKLFEEAEKLLKEYTMVIESPEGDIIYSNASHVDDMPSINSTSTFMFKEDIPNSDWILFCYVPVQEVTGNAVPILHATFIVTGICIVILFGIISVFAKGMLRRIYQLHRWMKRVEQGELDIEVHSTSQDEIGDLTIRFGNMLVHINELLHEVRRKELIALQAQMNPHFLYNTLSSINWKALQTKSYEISRIVTAMSKYYRTALNKGENLISLRHELDNVKSYLDIMLITSDNSFDVIYEIDETIYQYDTINMILQPLAENAIKHGLEQMPDRKGELIVTASLDKEKIRIAIKDNGPGMNVELLYKVRLMQSSGYGLSNVNERIRLHFGSEYGLSVHSEENHGTTMIITLPRFNKPVEDALSDLQDSK
ncbi:histidine kinase [Paenibacillus sp. LHD-117]|uniref:sensor histidine kinase n=1 Tax=Paenibacillus sp. LHD-117 TaxID=3071412 RepID=UPI0027E12F83|nr:histidine kinase [Paenibacillus sp. LHD-117]MDQ6419986.1 histidine kinase [Paenibacillus sp. LHD-117]